MEDTFDYIDFVQNKRLQQNLQEWEEKEPPKEVTDRVKKMAQAMVDPTLLDNFPLKEETQFDLDPEGDAMNRVNEARQDDGWIFNGNDEDGCSFYKKAGYEIRVKVQLV